MAAIAAVLAALGGCTAETAESYLESGKTYAARHDYPAAIIQLKNAVQKAPESAEARYLLGLTLAEAGDLPAAEIELRKAAAAGYAPELAYPALARVLVAQARYKEALVVSSTELASREARAELLALGGEAQLGLGAIEPARKAFAAAVESQPTNNRAALGMARIAAVDGESARAHALVDELLLRAPGFSDAHLLRGDLLALRGDSAAATQAYDKVIALEPANLRAHLRLVPLLLREKQAQAARERISALQKVAPGAVSAVYLDAMVSYAEGKLPQAREALLQVLRVAPEHAPTLLLAGVVEHDRRNHAQAEEHLRKVVAAVPRAEYPRRLLATSYLRSGQPHRAREVLAPLLQGDAQTPAVLALAGEIALADGQVKQAAQYFERTLAQNPKNTAVRVRLGQAHIAAGETRRAIEDLELASRSDAQQIQADVALVTLHLSRGELQDAHAAIEALLRKQPDNPLPFNLRGLVHLAAKQDPRARADFEHALALQADYFPAAHNLALLDRREGKLQDARGRYETILAQHAGHEQAQLALIELLQSTAAPAQEVEQAIERALASNPASVRAHLLKVRHWAARRDSAAALAAARAAESAAPHDARVLDALARAQLDAGETNQALATFARLASLAPESPAPLISQAQAFSAVKDWANARAALSQALRLNADLLPARRALANVHLQEKAFEPALDQAREIQRRWPTRAEGWLAEAEVLHVQGRPLEAEKLLRGALERLPQSPLAIALFAQLQREGKRAQAQAFAEQWSAGHPADTALPALAGEASMATGDHAAAARWYRRALKAQPNSAVLLNNLAWSLGQSKDPSALEYAMKALELAPNNPSILDTAGWLNVQQGRMAEGLPLLERAYSLAPAAAPIRLNLAKALLRAGDKNQARPHLEWLARLPAESPAQKEASALLAEL
jgi:putative PEP-CTERM system TPR-repeat lipoprotein